MNASRCPRSNSYLVRFAVVTSMALVVGCSSSEFPLESVAGVVTLDGSPLAEAQVRFTPQATGKLLVGPPSMGITDAQGRFALETREGLEGAVVGEHRVRITTGVEKSDPNNLMKAIVVAQERVPEKYHLKSTLTFDVPDGGTDSCNFDLTTK